MHCNESFPKGQGLLGGNPGTRAWFRVRRETDTRAKLASGRVPESLDELNGVEERVGFHEHPIAIGPDDVWEYCSPTTPGYGDPLCRDPRAVLADVQEGLLTPESALEVYGVVSGGSTHDPALTHATRAKRRAERLKSAEDPE
jgi:N-methylhydantoinase B